jgi:phosphoribosyl 1,2-cyclic phosphodiesterase
MESNYIKFLGTAGSRWVVARQLRASGGIFLSLLGKRIHLDPGPGALVRCAMSDPPIDPSYLDAIVLTHTHIDHSNDVNILIDAMTGGGFNRGGSLFAPKSCLNGEAPVVLTYLRPFLNEIVELAPQHDYAIGEVRFSTSIPHNHGTDTFGLRFYIGAINLSFLVDTRYFEELPAAYAGSDILVIYVTFLDTPPHPRILHLCVEDARRIIDEVRPRQAVLTHFGMSMIEAGPESVAHRLSDQTGIEVVAATDGLVVPISNGEG